MPVELDPAPQLAQFAHPDRLVTGEWLEASEHVITDGGSGFLKVLSPAWLDA